jgi:hypothetical protein
MNSARDLLRSYMEILSEAPAAPAPTPKAGLAQPPAAGASRPAAAPQGQMATAQDVDDGAFKRPTGTTAPVDTANGGTVQQNKLTGMKTVSDETGSKTYDAGGNLVKTAEPSIGGMSKSTDVTTGDTTTAFNAGDVGVSSTQTAGGYEKERSSRYQMGDVGVAASKTAPNYAQGQLASPTTSTATTSAGQQATAVSGVGFGGASGSNVGNNTVTSGDQELANLAKIAAPQPGQQAVQEEDTHEHPESARHLLKKLLKLLKDEDKVDEDFIPTDPKEVGAKMNEPYISPAARAQDKPNPHANAPEPKKIDAKTTAVPDAKFEGMDSVTGQWEQGQSKFGIKPNMQQDAGGVEVIRGINDMTKIDPNDKRTVVNREPAFQRELTDMNRQGDEAEKRLAIAGVGYKQDDPNARTSKPNVDPSTLQDLEEKKIEESLMHLYKAIKEGRIQ